MSSPDLYEYSGPYRWDKIRNYFMYPGVYKRIYHDTLYEFTTWDRSKLGDHIILYCTTNGHIDSYDKDRIELLLRDSVRGRYDPYAWELIIFENVTKHTDPFNGFRKEYYIPPGKKGVYPYGFGRMPEAEEEEEPQVTPEPQQAQETELRWLEVLHLDPYDKMPWQVEDTKANIVTSGILDAGGLTPRLTGFKSDSVQVTLGEKDRLSNDLIAYRDQLKVTLRNIVALYQQQGQAQSQKEQQASFLTDTWWNLKAEVSGMVDAGKSAVESTVQFIFHPIDSVNSMSDLIAVLVGDAEVRAELLQFIKVMVLGPQSQEQSSYMDGQIAASAAIMLGTLRITPDAILGKLFAGPRIFGFVGNTADGLFQQLYALCPKLASTIEKMKKSTTVKALTNHRMVIKPKTTLNPDKEAYYHLNENEIKKPEIVRPEGVDEGAVHESQVKELPGYEAEDDLAHPAGEQYNLKAREAKNFYGKPVAKTLPPGTKIYRIIETDTNNGIYPNGRYWAYSLPDSLREWRAEYAVKGWNKDGYYVEYTVGPNGLVVWEGVTASQTYDKDGLPGWLLKGGKLQIFIPQAKNEIPADLSLHPTNWSK